MIDEKMKDEKEKFAEKSIKSSDLAKYRKI